MENVKFYLLQDRWQTDHKKTMKILEQILLNVKSWDLDESHVYLGANNHPPRDKSFPFICPHPLHLEAHINIEKQLKSPDFRKISMMKKQHQT